jgi:ATP-dependent helicase/nuclease subunit B
MTASAARQLESVAIDEHFWPGVAADVAAWLAAAGVAARDAIVLLPHAGVLAPARAAFARRGGWQPRIETVASLAEALAPPAAAAPGMFSGERGTDRLVAATLLRQRAFGAAWAERDPRAFNAAVEAFIHTAQALHDASAMQAPVDRDAWWQALRQALPPTGGPGASERLLARLAVEWAASAQAPMADALRAQRPAAWVAISAGGRPTMPTHLPSPGVPVLHLQMDGGDAARPFDAAAALAPPRRLRAAGLEEEASAAAIAVLEALDGGAASVALIAQDRLVVRRIRALLERAAVSIDDETGWTLSTTRAAAKVMAWLRAAAPGAGRDAVIEALRAEGSREAAVSALERTWRHEREARAGALAVHDDLMQRIEAMQPRRARALDEWLAAVRQAAPGLMVALQADAAGRQVLWALQLHGDMPPGWRSAAQATRCDWHGFTAWVDAVLEDQQWRPARAVVAAVTILPLSRALLRPFDAVVFPGCDAQHLGAGAAPPGLLPQALAREFGVAEIEQRRLHETLAFAQLLRAPRLTLLRRSSDAGQPLTASPLVERAMLARRRLGTTPAAEQDVSLPTQRVPRRRVPRPAPSMAMAMPQSLSATTVELLRDCPYRFFARVGLRLSEDNELEVEIDNRDNGRWMHALLHRFHTQRSGSDDAADLLAAADFAQSQLGLDGAALLPYRAAFDDFARRYLEWLRAHEEAGWHFAAGEVQRRCAPLELDGVELEGRLDRIDSNGDDGAAMLIDYKTSAREALAKRVKEPLEDTQLAFYATLLTDERHDEPPHAVYLPLNDRKPLAPIEHRDVALSAALLVEGLGNDLAALRAGQGAAALGEGQVCKTCEMRGLCRRDHWARE